MAPKLFSFIALLILACSFSAAPVHALSVDTSLNHARHNAVFAKRDLSRRCKSRPASSLVSKPTTHPSSSTNKAVKAAAPTPVPAPAHASTPSSGGGGNGKAGIAWANSDDSTLPSFKTSKTSTIYTWSASKPANCEKAGFDFAIMFWGIQHQAEFVANAVAGYGKYVMGFNEPEIGSQANLDTGTAANLWREFIEPLKNKGYTLVSPAVTSDSQGLPWLKDFIDNKCSGCTIDVVALHWYGINAQDFISYVENAHSTLNKPIWVTEVACQNFAGPDQCSQSQTNEFLTTIVDWMDATDYVEKYFYFAPAFNMAGVNNDNNLMAPNGQPSALGQIYLTRNT